MTDVIISTVPSKDPSRLKYHNAAVSISWTDDIAELYHIQSLDFAHFSSPFRETYEHPDVAPQVSHLRQVPLRTSVKLPHSSQLSPS